MLWVNRQCIINVFYSYSAVIDFSRQNLTSTDAAPTERVRRADIKAGQVKGGVESGGLGQPENPMYVPARPVSTGG